MMTGELKDGVYQDDGHTRESRSGTSPPLLPARVLFDFPQGLRKHIREAQVRATEAVEDFDLDVTFFEEYGKGFIKTCVPRCHGAHASGAAVVVVPPSPGHALRCAIRRGMPSHFVRRRACYDLAPSSVGVSPDAYLQMALQITYFRNMHRFPLTYESAMARLFKQVRQLDTHCAVGGGVRRVLRAVWI